LPGLLTTPAVEPVWEHQRRLLTTLFEIDDILAGLRELPDMLEQQAAEVENSKARDDERGARIIDDYADAHTAAAADAFVKQCWEQTRRWQREVAELLAWIAPGELRVTGAGRTANSADLPSKKALSA